MADQLRELLAEFALVEEQRDGTRNIINGDINGPAIQADHIDNLSL